jgi:hypothetical protein
MRNLKHDIEVRGLMLHGTFLDQIQVQVDRSQPDENGADPMERIYLLTALQIDTILRPTILQYEVMESE